MADPAQYLDREGFQRPAALEPKTIHAGDRFDGQPYLHVDEDGIALVADRKTLVALDKVFGLLLGGPISLSTMPDQLAFAGGYYRLNPLVLSTVPSTTPTPIPMLVKAEPKLLAARKKMGGILSELEAGLGI